MYKDLRFMGFYVHEDSGYERARHAIMDEMEARKPDKDSSGGYQPADKFKEAVSKFRDDHRAYGQDLLDRAQKKQQVTREEVITLDRAEKLYAMAKPAGLEQAFKNVAMLEQGLNSSGNGRSMTALVKRATGIDLEDSIVHHRQMSIAFRPMNG